MAAIRAARYREKYRTQRWEGKVLTRDVTRAKEKSGKKFAQGLTNRNGKVHVHYRWALSIKHFLPLLSPDGQQNYLCLRYGRQPFFSPQD